MIELARRDDVWVLRMDEGENRFNRTSIDALHAALDEVAGTPGPADAKVGFIDDVHRLFGRVLGLDVYAVAAVNGHAFAGGAMLASAHDAVVMREDRGYWCLPEVDLGLPLTDAMYATVAAHLPPATLAESILSGRRYGGADAVAAGIAVDAVAEDAVVDRAVELAAAYAAKDRNVLGAHKRLLHGTAITTCGA